MVRRDAWCGLVTGALASACGSDVTLAGSGGGAASTATTSTTSTSAASTTSTTTGGGTCCADLEVDRTHDCLPTTELGCGEACVAGGCPVGWRCDDCAASGPCGEEICQPACVLDPEVGPASELRPGDLRLRPTQVEAGEPVTILGAPLYVGALWYAVRVGAGWESALEGAATGGPCAQAFASEGIPAGTHPVWVSQYGGGDPWVLAGILTVGGAPSSCAQPGYPCVAADDCCQADGVTVACDAGHCLAD